MCWVGYNPKKHVALEDISVFKIGIKDKDEKLWSYYYDFTYKEGMLYNTKIGVLISIGGWNRSICEGFHSYSNHCEIRINRSVFIIYPNTGKYLDILTGNLVRLNCIIPKGSEYYLNERGEYVSNQIKIINVKDVLDKL